MSEQELSKLNDNTYVITSEKTARESIEKAVYDYNNKSNFRSVEFNDKEGIVNFKIDDIDNLAFNAQTNLNNILKINNIVRLFINKNDILGKVYEAIETNVNPDWELNYPNFNSEEKEMYDYVDYLIREFNEKINVESIIVESIPMAYIEGNYCMYLRKDKDNKNYQVDYYPLGVCELSDYSEGGEPFLLIDIKELESRLRKVYQKNRKNKALFYENADQEILATYPLEVYEAYKNKDKYAILKIENSGAIRTNNFKRKYGLTPIFKALKPVIRLENIEISDDKNTQVRGKKIIFQKLSKELFTNEATKRSNIGWLEAQAKAHTDLMTALSQPGITVFTGTPWTESVSYVETQQEQTNVQVKKSYRDQILSSVGISYLSADKGSFGAAQISINELLKVINRISEQLETILEKWYKGLLIDEGIDVKYAPKIKVLDSEKLNVELSMQLARMLNTELNASLETTYAAIGLDVKTEARRRKEESELGYEDIFKPRMTAYTNNGKSDNVGGNPGDSTDLDKQDSDKDYNKENNR